MTITISELLNNSFVISIDDTRATYFYKRFYDAGLKNPYPKLFRGYKMRTGDYKELKYHQGTPAFNCSRSHYDIVNIGASLGLPFVCIFEDDACPCVDCIDHLKDALEDLPDNAKVIRLGWGILQQSRMKVRLRKLDSKGLYDNNIGWGSHAQIITASYYDRYREIFNSVNALADVALLNAAFGNEREEGNILKIIRPIFMQKDEFEYRPMSCNQGNKALNLLATKDDFNVDTARITDEDKVRFNKIKEGCYDFND